VEVGGVVVANDFDEVVGIFHYAVAVVEQEAVADEGLGAGEGPAGVVVAGDDADRAGRGGDEGLGVGAGLRGGAGGVEGVAEPDEFCGGVGGEEGAQGGLDLVVAPGGEEVAGGAVALGVAPVQIGDDEGARGRQEEGEARVEDGVGEDVLVNH
jgi:hypothetical protein